MDRNILTRVRWVYSGAEISTLLSVSEGAVGCLSLLKKQVHLLLSYKMSAL